MVAQHAQLAQRGPRAQLEVGLALLHLVVELGLVEEMLCVLGTVSLRAVPRFSLFWGMLALAMSIGGTYFQVSVDFHGSL